MQHYIKQIYVKNQEYIADTDTTDRVLRFQFPSLFFKLTCSFQVDYTYHYSREEKLGLWCMCSKFSSNWISAVKAKTGVKCIFTGFYQFSKGFM